MTQGILLNVFLVEVYYWSRTTATYLKEDWRNQPLMPEVGNLHTDPVAIFSTKDRAESEALAFVAAHPQYLGTVKVEAVVSGARVCFRD